MESIHDAVGKAVEGEVKLEDSCHAVHTSHQPGELRWKSPAGPDCSFSKQLSEVSDHGPQ